MSQEFLESKDVTEELLKGSRGRSKRVDTGHDFGQASLLHRLKQVETVNVLVRSIEWNLLMQADKVLIFFFF